MLRPLVEHAANGDEEAFAALVAAVGDHCMAIAYRILRDVDRAEDAVQVAFVAAWRDLRALRDPDRFESWLHRTLVNACYAEARRGRRGGLNIVELEIASPTPDEYARVQDRDRLERGFRRLTPEQRAVLVFHYYLGLEVAEVAEQLGIPLGTAKSRLHYASLALRAAIEADDRGTRPAKERSA